MGDTTIWRYYCTVDRIIDGDTIDLIIDLGFFTHTKIRVRLLDIDTPEIRGPERPEGLQAKAFVEEWLAERDVLVVETHKTGKYGRWLADLWVTGHDQSLVEALKSAGYDT